MENAAGPEHLGDGGWWSRERTLSVALFLLTGLGIVLCYFLARPFLTPLAWALALSIISRPMHRWLVRKVRSRNVAAALAVALVAVTIVGPGYFVIQQLAREATTGVQQIQTRLTTEHWRELTKTNTRLAGFARWVEEQLDLTGSINTVATWISGQAVAIVGGSFRILIELLIMFFLLFYFFRDEASALSALRSLLPLSKTETDMMFQLVDDTIHGTVYGTLMAAFLQGLLGGLMFWWLGLPSPLVWGIVMGLLAVVPVLGPFVVWIPAAVVLSLQGHWIKALILTGWGAVIIGLIDNLVYPMLVGKRLHFHTVPVFIALIGGLILFGTAGLVLGPIVMAMTVALLEVWRQRTTGGSTVETGFGPPLADADTFTARIHPPKKTKRSAS